MIRPGDTVPGKAHGHAQEDPSRPAMENAARLAKQWRANTRWNGVERPYTAEDVCRLRGSVYIEHSLARKGAERLWRLIVTMSKPW